MGKEIDLSSSNGGGSNKIDKVNGAENYIAKFKADGNLNKSSLYEVSGKGTLETKYKFYVKNNFYVKHLTTSCALSIKSFDSSSSGVSPMSDISLVGGDSNAQHLIRFFRETNTTSTVAIDILKGNNTQAANIRLGANTDTYLNALTGKVGIGTSAPQSSLFHIKQGTSGGSSFKNTTTLIETSGSSNLYQALKISTRGNVEALNVTNAGKVGIGIKVPNVSLVVKNKDDDNRYETTQSITSSGGSLLEFRDMDNIKVDFGSVHGNPVIRANYNIHFKMLGSGSKEGYIGLDVSNPQYRLELPNNNDNSGRGRANAWAIYSDSRLKLEQKKLKYGLNEILKIQPKSFMQYGGSIEKGKVELKDNGTKSIGLIAQELKDIIPEAVNTPDDEKEDFYAIDYNKMVPVLINAIKELKQEIEELKAKNVK